MIKIGLVLSLLVMTGVLMAADSSRLSDPTRPLINTNAERVKSSNETRQTAPKKKRNQLMAIIVDNKNRKAIIDEKTIAVGDLINGYRVHRIETNRVILRKGQSYKTLTLAPSVKAVNKQG